MRYLVPVLAILVTGCGSPTEPWKQEGYISGEKPEGVTYLWCYSTSELVEINELMAGAKYERTTNYTRLDSWLAFLC